MDGVRIARGRGGVDACSAVRVAAVDREHHGVGKDVDGGLLHLVDEPLGVFRSGELLFKVLETKSRMDALAKDTAQVRVSFYDGDAGAGCLRGERGPHSCWAAANDQDVIAGAFTCIFAHG